MQRKFLVLLFAIVSALAAACTPNAPTERPSVNAERYDITGRVISVDKAGRIFIQETEVALDQLGPRLQAITANKADTRIFVRGDRAIDYGAVMTVMGTVNQAGFTRVALLTELPGGTPVQPAAPVQQRH